MKRMKKFFAGLLVIGFLAGCASPEPHPNLSILKRDCVRWHDSGEYDAAFAKAALPARRWLERSLTGKPVGNQAVVFDIDETLLSNWGYLVSGQFALLPDTFAAWTKREKAVALAPTRDIYNRALAAGVPIFLITGRSETLREATIRDLKEAGFSGWSGLYLKPLTYKDLSVVPYKSGIRKMLTERGYDIILNMGDQYSDLDGGFARQRYKLPNPFYFLP